MFRFSLAIFLSCFVKVVFSQNDLDAIRYARVGGGGSARFTAMGGAFGAVGAELTCAAYNPAGLAIFRKGEIAITAGLRTTNNTGQIYNKSTSVFDANIVFNNFGISAAWKAKNDPDSRHVIAFTNTQLQNFNSSIRMSGYTNSSSLGKDMLNDAQETSYNRPYDITGNMTSYSRLGFDAFLLDTANNKFFSFEDTKRTVKQTRDIVTSGRVNDLNFSYAYAYRDKFYFGGSLGFPQVSYESTTTHTDEDDKDSTRVTSFNSDGSISNTYIDYLPVAYQSRLGFKNLVYTEYFKTTGSGANAKLGGIIRANDMWRFGFYFHTPTLYRLQDSYYTDITVTFDKSGSTPDYAKNPSTGGYYKYSIITPAKYSASAAFIFKKLAVVSLDYEFVNYRGAKLIGDNKTDFADVNALIKTKYKGGHNVRVGGELNLNPLMVRAGYQMQGSPFGDVFGGPFVRNTFSIGLGFRTQNNFYFDFTVYKTLSTENYYLFTTMDTMAKLNYNSTVVSITCGIKF